MKLSIVIPIYNVEEFLEECLDSIVKQSTKEIDLEVILVDDGSLDQSSEIAEKYANEYATLFQYVKKENGGLSDARNFGVPYTTGDYLMFLDSDDLLGVNIVDTVGAILKKESCDLLVYNYNRFSSMPGTTPSISLNENREISKNEYLLLPPSAWNKVMKREIFIKNNLEFPKGLWYEDKGLTGSYVKYVDKIFYTPAIGCHYRVREGSITNQEKYNPKMTDIFKVMELLYNQLIETEFQEELEYLFIDSMLAGFPILFLQYNETKEVDACVNLLKQKYPNWQKNRYYIERGRQYHILCKLIFNKHYFLAKMVIKTKDLMNK